MAKKKSKGLLFLLCGAAASVAVLIFMALPALTTTEISGTISYSSTGYELLKVGDNVTVGLLLAFIFVVVAILISACLIALKLLKVKIKYEGIVCLVAAVFALAACVLFFLTKSFFADNLFIKHDITFWVILNGILLAGATFAFLVYGLANLKK